VTCACCRRWRPWCSELRDRRRRREDVAEAAELRRGAAEGELGPLGRREVAVHRVRHVDAHPAVNVDGRCAPPGGPRRRPRTWRWRPPRRPRGRQAVRPRAARRPATSSARPPRRRYRHRRGAAPPPGTTRSAVRNCSRLRAYSAVSSSARSATPACAAHSPTVPRAASQPATLRAPPALSRAPGRRPPATPSRTRRPASAPSVRVCGWTVTPASEGSTRKTSTASAADAGTSMRSARAAAGTAVLTPDSRQAAAVALGSRRRRRRVTAVLLAKRGGEHHGPVSSVPWPTGAAGPGSRTRRSPRPQSTTDER